MCIQLQVSLTSVNERFELYLLGGRGVNGYVFVLWVFVIGSLNKGNIDMDRDVFFYDVLRTLAAHY